MEWGGNQFHVCITTGENTPSAKKEWLRGQIHTPPKISQENGLETRRDMQCLDTTSRPIPAGGKGRIEDFQDSEEKGHQKLGSVYSSPYSLPGKLF